MIGDNAQKSVAGGNPIDGAALLRIWCVFVATQGGEAAENCGILSFE